MEQNLETYIKAIGLLQAASHAKTLALPESIKESAEVGPIFGLKCSDLLMKYDPHTSLLRMYQPLEVKDLNGFYFRLPKSGMTRNGTVYGQAKSTPHIEGKESGLLLTPTVMDSEALTNCLRKRETWEKAGKLTTQLMAICLGLTGKQSRPKQRQILNPSFVEWMMGYPTRWTELG